MENLFLKGFGEYYIYREDVNRFRGEGMVCQFDMGDLFFILICSDLDAVPDYYQKEKELWIKELIALVFVFDSH